MRILNTALTHRTVSKSSTREGDGEAGEVTLDFKWREESEDIFRLEFFDSEILEGRKIWQIFSWVVWQSEGARVCRPRNSVCFLLLLVLLLLLLLLLCLARAGGGLIFSPLIFLWGGGGVGNRREFFGFRPYSIIPIITWNPEYPPHSWSQAIIIRLYTFPSFSLKTITENTAVAFIREAYLTQEVHPWARITVAKVLLQIIILRYIYACLAPYFGSLNWSQLQGTTFTDLHLSLLCIPNNQMFLLLLFFDFHSFWGENDFTPSFFIHFFLLPKLGVKVGDGQQTTLALSRKGSIWPLELRLLTLTKRAQLPNVCHT